MCPKCKRVNCLTPMDFPHQDLGYKCILCCYEFYLPQPDIVGAKKPSKAGATKYD